MQVYSPYKAYTVAPSGQQISTPVILTSLPLTLDEDTILEEDRFSSVHCDNGSSALRVASSLPCSATTSSSSISSSPPSPLSPPPPPLSLWKHTVVSVVNSASSLARKTEGMHPSFLAEEERKMGREGGTTTERSEDISTTTTTNTTLLMKDEGKKRETGQQQRSWTGGRGQMRIDWSQEKEKEEGRMGYRLNTATAPPSSAVASSILDHVKDAPLPFHRPRNSYRVRIGGTASSSRGETHLYNNSNNSSREGRRRYGGSPPVEEGGAEAEKENRKGHHHHPTQLGQSSGGGGGGPRIPSRIQYYPLGTSKRYEQEKWLQLQRRRAQLEKAKEKELRDCPFQPQIYHYSPPTPLTTPATAPPSSPAAGGGRSRTNAPSGPIPDPSSKVNAHVSVPEGGSEEQEEEKEKDPEKGISYPASRDGGHRTLAPIPCTNARTGRQSMTKGSHISVFQRLVEAGKARDARLALARFYHEQQQKEQAFGGEAQVPPQSKEKKRKYGEEKEREKQSENGKKGLYSESSRVSATLQKAKEGKYADPTLSHFSVSSSSSSLMRQSRQHSVSSSRSNFSSSSNESRRSNRNSRHLSPPRTPDASRWFTPQIDFSSDLLATRWNRLCSHLPVEDRLLCYGACRDARLRQGCQREDSGMEEGGGENDAHRPMLREQSPPPPPGYPYCPHQQSQWEGEKELYYCRRTSRRSNPQGDRNSSGDHHHRADGGHHQRRTRRSRGDMTRSITSTATPFSSPPPTTAAAVPYPSSFLDSPLPRSNKKMGMQREESTRKGEEQEVKKESRSRARHAHPKDGEGCRSTHRLETTNATPTGGIASRTSSSAFSSFLKRQEDFLEKKRAKRMERCVAAGAPLSPEEFAQCTFSPAVNPNSALIDQRLQEKKNFLFLISSSLSSSSSLSRSSSSGAVAAAGAQTPYRVTYPAGDVSSGRGHPSPRVKDELPSPCCITPIRDHDISLSTSILRRGRGKRLEEEEEEGSRTRGGGGIIEEEGSGAREGLTPSTASGLGGGGSSSLYASPHCFEWTSREWEKGKYGSRNGSTCGFGTSRGAEGNREGGGVAPLPFKNTPRHALPSSLVFSSSPSSSVVEHDEGEREEEELPSGTISPSFCSPYSQKNKREKGERDGECSSVDFSSITNFFDSCSSASATTTRTTATRTTKGDHHHDVHDKNKRRANMAAPRERDSFSFLSSPRRSRGGSEEAKKREVMFSDTRRRLSQDSPRHATPSALSRSRSAPETTAASSSARNRRGSISKRSSSRRTRRSRTALLYEAALEKHQRDAERRARAQAEEEARAPAHPPHDYRPPPGVNYSHSFKVLSSQSFLKRQGLHDALHKEELRRLKEMIYNFETGHMNSNHHHHNSSNGDTVSRRHGHQPPPPPLHHQREGVDRKNNKEKNGLTTTPPPTPEGAATTTRTSTNSNISTSGSSPNNNNNNYNYSNYGHPPPTMDATYKKAVDGEEPQCTRGIKGVGERVRATSPGTTTVKGEECTFHPQLSPISLAVLERMKNREKNVVKRLTTVRKVVAVGVNSTFPSSVDHTKSSPAAFHPSKPRRREGEVGREVSAPTHSPRRENDPLRHQEDPTNINEPSKEEETEKKEIPTPEEPQKNPSRKMKKKVVTTDDVNAFFQREMERLQHRAFHIQEEKQKSDMHAVLECTFRPQTTIFPPRAASHNVRRTTRESHRACPNLSSSSPQHLGKGNGAEDAGGKATSHTISFPPPSQPHQQQQGAEAKSRGLHDCPGLEQFLERQALAKRLKDEQEERWRRLGAGMPINGDDHTILTPFHLETERRSRKSELGVAYRV